MPRGLNLKAVLSLEDKQFRKGINSIKRQLSGFTSFLKGAFAIGSITAFGKQMIQTGAEFENAMSRVRAVTNATTKDFQMMQAEAQKLGATTKYTATEAANALESLTRNGMTAQQATKALSGVLQVAQANAIDLASAADIVTNTLNAFGLGVSEVSRVNDVMSSAAANAATNISELYEAMTVAGPYSKIMGKSIEETASALGVLANKGIKGSAAGKALAAMYQRLAAITPKAAAEMAKYGLDIDEAKVKTQSLSKTLKQLKDSGIGDSVEALSNIFGKNFAGQIAQLINSVEDFDYMLDVTANSAGTTARMFEQGVGSVQKELDTLKSSYEGLLISISQKTSGVVKGAIRLLQNLVENFKTVGGTIMNIASVAVPLLGNKLLSLGRSFKTFFTMIKTEGAAATAMMGGWITAIASLVTWIGTALVGAWNRANQAMKDAKKHMEDAKRSANEMQDAVDDLKDAIGDGSNETSINGAVKRAIELFPQFASAIETAYLAAKKTKNYETLKRLLQEIADLQATIAMRDASEAIRKANAQNVGKKLWTNSNVWTWGGSIYTNYGKQTRDIRGQLEKRGLDKEGIKQVYNQIGEILTQYFSNEEDRVIALKELFARYKVTISDADVRKYIDDITNSNDINITHSRKKTTDKSVAYGQEAGTDVHKADSTMVDKAFKIAKETFDTIEKQANEDLKSGKLNKNQFQDKMYDAAQQFFDSASEIDGITDEMNAIVQKVLSDYPKRVVATNVSGDGGNTSTKAPQIEKTDLDKLTDSLKDFGEESTKLKNQWENNALTDQEYIEKLTELENKTWETIAAFSNLSDLIGKLPSDLKGLALELDNQAHNNRQISNTEATLKQRMGLEQYAVPAKPTRNTTFDYAKNAGEIASENVKIQFDYSESLKKLVGDFQAAIDNGDFNLVKDEALAQLGRLKEAMASASEGAIDLQHKLNLSESITALDDKIAELQASSFENITSIAQAFDRLMDSLLSIAEVFDEDLKDSEFYKGFEAFTSVLNAEIQAFEAVKTMIQAVQIAQDLAAKKKVAAAAKEVAADTAATTAATTKASADAAAAAAGGASAMASIPYVGPVLAVAAVAAIVAAIAAGMSKFATGGIVGGNSYSGDKNMVRVNSGELILNKAQQGTLWNILNGKGGVNGGNVEFRVRGSDLVGALNNYNRIRK